MFGHLREPGPGARTWGGKPVDYLQGAVDKVTVFDRALSATEVAALK